MSVLVYVGEGRPPWFYPDRIGNFRTDVPDNVNIVVVDRNNVPICGKVVPEVTTKYKLIAEDFELVGG